jgi:hypothetical protein
MPTVRITDQAVLFLKQRVAKKARQMLALPENEQIKNEREVKHWQNMDKKFSAIEDVQSINEIMLKRTELKSIQVTILDTMVHLQSTTIPAYRDRITKVPDKKEFYTEYVTKAEALYEGLADLLNTINKVINK